MLAIYVM